MDATGAHVLLADWRCGGHRQGLLVRHDPAAGPRDFPETAQHQAPRSRTRPHTTRPLTCGNVLLVKCGAALFARFVPMACKRSGRSAASTSPACQQTASSSPGRHRTRPHAAGPRRPAELGRRVASWGGGGVREAGRIRSHGRVHLFGRAAPTWAGRRRVGGRDRSRRSSPPPHQRPGGRSAATTAGWCGGFWPSAAAGSHSAQRDG